MKKRRTIKANKNFVSIFKQSIVKTSARRMKVLSEDFATDVIAAIELQMYNWPALNPDYLKSKEAAGLDTRILIATGKYMKSIKSIRTVDKDLGVIYSTGPVGKTAKGIPLTLLARWLEYGTAGREVKTEDGVKRVGGMPAREHWRPTWSIFLANKAHTKKKLKEEILREFSKDIKSKNKPKVRKSK